MNVQYSNIANKVLVDHEDELWVDGELMMLRSEIVEFKRVVERVFASHCSIGLYTLKFHLLNYLLD